MKEILWRLCLGALAGHELDAVAQAEWRLLYGLRELEAGLAQGLFIALHMPLCMGLLWLGGHANGRVRQGFRRLLAGFAVVHGGLHFNLREHPLYSFDSPLSQALIFGAAAAGLLYLLMDLWSVRRPLPPLTARIEQ